MLSPLPRASYHLTCAAVRGGACRRLLISQLSSKDTLYKVPLSRMVYDSISQCSIDLRKPLVRNIVLSGGSSLFKDFGKRLERDIKKDIKAREKRNEEMLGEELLRKHRAENTDAAMSSQVKVVSHEFQRFAVWFGGSIVSSQSNFDSVVVSRSTYEYHPVIMVALLLSLRYRQRLMCMRVRVQVCRTWSQCDAPERGVVSVVLCLPRDGVKPVKQVFLLLYFIGGNSTISLLCPPASLTSVELSCGTRLSINIWLEYGLIFFSAYLKVMGYDLDL